MPIGYSGAPRVTQSNQASRLRRLSRSLVTGNNGTPMRITLIGSERLQLEASPLAANTNARRDVLQIYSSEFKNADDAVVNAVVNIGYQNDCGLIEIRCGADNTLIWSINNTFGGGPGGILYMGSSGLMKAVNTAFIWDETNINLKLVANSAITTPMFTLEQDGAGDAFINFLLTATAGWSFGIDNSDSDKLKISAANTIGTNSVVITSTPALGVGVSPVSSMDTDGSTGSGITEVNVNTTLTAAHSTVLVNCNALNRVITLPAAAGVARRKYTIKKIDAAANTVTVDGNGAETIDGAANTVLSTQYDATTIQSDGTSWWILSTK